MNEKRLEAINSFIHDNFDTPRLSPYLQLVVSEVEEFLDSEDFSLMTADLAAQYFLLFQVLNLAIGFLRYKHADRARVVSVLGEIIRSLRSSLQMEGLS